MYSDIQNACDSDLLHSKLAANSPAARLSDVLATPSSAAFESIQHFHDSVHS